MAYAPDEPPALFHRPWTSFRAAPHRMLFFAGMVQCLAVLVWWALELAGRAAGTVLLPVVGAPPAWAHGFLMIYGIFPFFIFGFLFTVYPRWMNGPEMAPRAYIAAFGLLSGGMLLFYAGLFTARAVLVTGLSVYLAGWVVSLANLLAVYRRATTRGMHEPLLNGALAAGAFGIACFVYAVVAASTSGFALAREIGLWLFLTPVVFLVSHRMIPFFSQTVLMNYMMRRPSWAPPLMLAGTAAHAGFELSGLSAWRFVADLPLAVAALHLSYVWQFRKSFHARLLAMLHIAFLWLGIAMTLYSAQSLLLLTTGADWLGRAPLHALGIGFLTGMIVAMASRVTLGHSGRSLIADNLTWAVLLGVNLTAAVRIVAEFIPAAAAWLNLAAALLWLAAFALWGWHYLPMYLRPRVDAKPG
jgi:uncharacterized protein involved in response to NO